MTTQEQALVEIAALLAEAGVPYMVVGGMANIVWGEPRATLDIDVTVWVPDPEIPAFIERVSRRFTPLVEQPVEFVADTRVLPIENRAGVRIDLIHGLLPFEREAIDRAIAMTIGDASVRFCTPEDLVLMKIVSDRERDIEDARAVVRRRRRDLDVAYLEPRILELATLLERPDIRERWERWMRGR